MKSRDVRDATIDLLVSLGGTVHMGLFVWLCIKDSDDIDRYPPEAINKRRAEVGLKSTQNFLTAFGEVLAICKTRFRFEKNPDKMVSYRVFCTAYAVLFFGMVGVLNLARTCLSFTYSDELPKHVNV